MTLKSDIRISSAIKEVNGASALSANVYNRAIYHTSRQEFVLMGINGIVYSLDEIANKVQQAPSVPGAGMPNPTILFQDRRSSTQTIISDRLLVAIDDGNLDNWVIGSASSQSTRGVFTLSGDSLLYKLEERLSFSTDNFVADETLGNTIFSFPGMRICATTQNGRIFAAALNDEVGFITQGDDPDIAANWNVTAIAPAFSVNGTVSQMAINDAGTLAIIGTERGEIGYWVLGNPVVIYPAANNPFQITGDSASNTRVGSIIYSAFWGGFIITSTTGIQVAFVDETNFTDVQSAFHLGAIAKAVSAFVGSYPAGAANPAGEILITPSTGAHTLLMNG